MTAGIIRIRDTSSCWIGNNSLLASRGSVATIAANHQVTNGRPQMRPASRFEPRPAGRAKEGRSLAAPGPSWRSCVTSLAAARHPGRMVGCRS